MEVLTAMEHLHCVNLLTTNNNIHPGNGFVGVQYYNIQAKLMKAMRSGGCLTVELEEAGGRARS
jgi:hypothetical protein